jgi:signal transduction histidine kinase
LLVRLLRATATARRASGAVWLADAERRIDGLADGLAALRAELDTRVRDAKLTSMAEFACGASHEINNPLAVISGHAQMLLAGEVDSDKRKQLGAIIRQTRRVHDLLQGTLQFARPSRPAAGPVRLADWLAEVVAGHRPDAEAKGVALDCGLDVRTAGVVVWADPGQLRQALAQLVRNAVEAAPPGGWVRVAAEARGDGWAVTVEDSGPGPSPAQVEHLFDPFFSGRSAGRGAGLGLSIAWRLARLNGGDVRYEPTGGPTRFVLILPPAGGLAPPARPERKSA